jgi:hypothetical protein
MPSQINLATLQSKTDQPKRNPTDDEIEREGSFDPSKMVPVAKKSTF